MSHGARLECIDLTQVYSVDGEDVVALRRVNFELTPGEQAAVVGPSGSGKSTLTTLIAGLRRPTSGQVRLDDTEVGALSEKELLDLRAREVGIVVQNPSRSLLPYASAEDNIRFAQRAAPRAHRAELPRPLDLLGRLGLEALAGRPVARLSGGEQQRLAVAVGLASTPRLLLADEPTSQLDHHNRDLVIELLERIAAEIEATTLVVTHDPEVAQALGRAIVMSEGSVVKDSAVRAVSS